jgi:hypothetical protein
MFKPGNIIHMLHSMDRLIQKLLLRIIILVEDILLLSEILSLVLFGHVLPLKIAQQLGQLFDKHFKLIEIDDGKTSDIFIDNHVYFSI